MSQTLPLKESLNDEYESKDKSKNADRELRVLKD